MIRIRNEMGERAVTPEEFIQLVATGQVREDDWICGETLTDDQWVRAGDHPFFRRYAPAEGQESTDDAVSSPSVFYTQRERTLRFLDTLFRTPHLTFALIAINVLIWLLMSAVGGWQTFQPLLQQGVVSQPLALFPQFLQSFIHGSERMEVLMRFGAKENTAIRQAGEYWRLLTCMFLHIGPLHLLMNSYALFLFGRFAENVYGKQRFLVIYFLAGLGGSLASYWFSPSVSAGASGAIFGLLGVMLAFNLRHYQDIPQGLRRNLLINLVVILVLNLAIGFSFRGIDNNGHIGGLITGALLGFLLDPEILAARSRRPSLVINMLVAVVLGSLVYAAWGMGQSLKRPWSQQTIVQSDPRAHLIAGMRWMQSKRYDMAVREFRLALQFLPNNPEVNLLLADALAEKGDTTEAVATYKRVLSLNPDKETLHRASNNLAYLYADQLGTHLDEAQRLSQDSLRLSPNNPIYLDTLGWIYYKQNKLKEAEETLDKAVRLAPREAELHYHLGAVYEARGKGEQARSAYHRALLMNPTHEKAREAMERMESKVTL